MTKLISLEVRNFKSLADVKIDFSHLTCLIGMNGAGKSSILQSLDYFSQLMRGNIQTWLDQRDWTAGDLNCKLISESNITTNALLELNSGVKVVWFAAFNRRDLRCTREYVRTIDGKTIFTLSSGRYFIDEPSTLQDIQVGYQGSFIAHLRLGDDPIALILKEIRDFIKGVQSLELLSPNLMRKRARKTDKDIGAGGEKLSAFLGSLKGEAHDKLLGLLRNFYPNIQNFSVSNLRSGWKRLNIIEQFGYQKLETEARHINDGLLRILAILAQTETVPSILLLDEIENGINQEIVDKLVKVLLEAPAQIVITTHSPLVLNYFPDDVAKDSVQFVYKSPLGKTSIRPFFKIPRIAEKLQVMGPGEAFVDTDLKSLTQESLEQDIKDAEHKAMRFEFELQHSLGASLRRSKP
ncbi:MAG: AAA family ATPase [Agitococcus sp.]|nr:AAA family ATPase [Agitococcus sp.]